MLSDEQRDRLEAWVMSVGPRAVAYARSLVSDANRAEDLVQECLYRLLRNADRYNLEQDGVKLLFKAISNLCINRAVRERALRSLDGAGPDDTPIAVVDPIGLRPDAIAELREREEEVRAALLQLPEMQRAAVELRALGLSKEQIGEVLEVTPGHAGVLVHRGRRALATVLGLEIYQKKS